MMDCLLVKFINFIFSEKHATIYYLYLSIDQSESMFDEKEILRGCIKQDRKAQRQLFEQYASGLLGVCMRFTGNRAEAEDILQDGFVKIFNNIGFFEGRSSLIGWMRRIVINTAITHYHKNLKHQHHYDIEELREIKAGDSGFGESEFTREEMLNVIASLPAGYKMVFNLYAIEGYKHKEIAEKLNIDINTSKSQYSRARKLIQYRLSLLGNSGIKPEGFSENEEEGISE